MSVLLEALYPPLDLAHLGPQVFEVVLEHPKGLLARKEAPMEISWLRMAAASSARMLPCTMMVSVSFTTHHVLPLLSMPAFRVSPLGISPSDWPPSLAPSWKFVLPRHPQHRPAGVVGRFSGSRLQSQPFAKDAHPHIPCTTFTIRDEEAGVIRREYRIVLPELRNVRGIPRGSPCSA